MTSHCKKPLMLITLALNLIFGNLTLLVWNGWNLYYSMSMTGCYSLSAVLLLLYEFTRIKAESSWIAVVLLGLLVSLLIPFGGAFLYGLLNMPYFATGLLEGIFKSLIWAILSMSMAALLIIQFAVGNLIAFFILKKRKQRKAFQT